MDRLDGLDRTEPSELRVKSDHQLPTDRWHLDMLYAPNPPAFGILWAIDVPPVEEQGWSLNPDRYVGVAYADIENIEFTARVELLEEQLATLTTEAAALSDVVQSSIHQVLRR